ncbi:hypothetical protein [Arenimonas daejeonensis]|uniref:hypothetical protein n=1 Tax=Arenimonas daejeonensis TaxID=370777 RepID=UPI0011BD695F|nr:hypothetical protein [Arenimonas daejeonensis]
MSWNLQQQGMLAAMGYTLYRPAGATPAAPAANPGDVAEAGPDRTDKAVGDRLMQALQRAAGGRDLSGLALPPLESLRSDAAAKRRLWPVLRALRRR